MKRADISSNTPTTDDTATPASLLPVPRASRRRRGGLGPRRTAAATAAPLPIALQSLCMRVGQIIILWIAFTGLLSAQSAPQGQTGPAAKLPPARIEKKSPAPKLTAPVPIFRDVAAQQ